MAHNALPTAVFAAVAWPFDEAADLQSGSQPRASAELNDWLRH